VMKPMMESPYSVNGFSIKPVTMIAPLTLHSHSTIYSTSISLQTYNCFNSPCPLIMKCNGHIPFATMHCQSPWSCLIHSHFLPHTLHNVQWFHYIPFIIHGHFTIILTQISLDRYHPFHIPPKYHSKVVIATTHHGHWILESIGHILV